MPDLLALACARSFWLGLTAAGAAAFLLYSILTDVRDLATDRAKAAAMNWRRPLRQGIANTFLGANAAIASNYPVLVLACVCVALMAILVTLIRRAGRV